MSLNSLLRSRLLSRFIWVFAAVLSSVAFIYALPFRYTQLLSDPFDLAQGLQALGFTVRDFAIYATALNVLFAMACNVVAWLLFWRKADDRMVYLFSLTLIMFTITILPVLTVFQYVDPAWSLLMRILRALGLFIIGASMMTFPDGEYVPRWTRWGLLAWFVYCVLNPIYPGIAPITDYTDLRLATNILRVIPVFAVLGFVALAQGLRYRYHSTPSQRQQTKWVVLGMLMSLGITAGLTLPPLAWSPLRTSTVLFTIYLIAVIPLTLGVFTLFPISITFAVLRYRLWDIDVIIRRTLVYAVLTSTLALLYFGLVISLEAALRALMRSSGQIATVISTLSIAALFTPLRRRVQDLIDRRFYRQKYDAQRALATFAETARNETDLEVLSTELQSLVKQSMQPEHLSLWINTPAKSGRSHDLELKS